jgi:hypothetical protein
LKRPEVSSVGTKRNGNGQYALVIGLAKESAALKTNLRRKLEDEGVPVVFEKVGTFRKL